MEELKKQLNKLQMMYIKKCFENKSLRETNLKLQSEISLLKSELSKYIQLVTEGIEAD